VFFLMTLTVARAAFYNLFTDDSCYDILRMTTDFFCQYQEACA